MSATSAISHPLADEDLLAYLRLARTPRVGPVTFQRLLSVYGTPHDALAALPDLARNGGQRRPFKIFARHLAEEEIRQTRDYGGEYAVWGQADYPEPLAHIHDAPMLMATFGNRALLDKPACISIVGARNASAAGLKLTQQISAGLSAHGYVIASGLARGIDAMAHRHALKGGTIAVLGNGIAEPYPRENKELQEHIQQSGLIICENPPDTSPKAQRFPRRNRIIAGLAVGVIVIEAARRSGSLITARLANEFGRQVMAVPGSPLDARCHGTNNLIREGAALIENVQDVLHLTQPLLTNPPPAGHVSATDTKPVRRPKRDLTSPERERILRLLSPVPTSIDELVSLSALPVDLVHLAILELQIAGRVSIEASGKITLLEA